MTQDSTTYNVWIGGSCDYGHKERVGGDEIAKVLAKVQNRLTTILLCCFPNKLNSLTLI